jgi:hypothetical protein
MSTQEPLAVQEMTDIQFNEHVLKILDRELGADGVARFLLSSKHEGRDYTRDRHKWQKGLTIAQVVAGIEEQRKLSKAG